MEESKKFLVNSEPCQEDIVGNSPSSSDSGSETDRPSSYTFHEETGIMKARETRTAAIEDPLDHSLDTNVFVPTPQRSAEDQIEPNGLAIRIDNIDSLPKASMVPLHNGGPMAYSGNRENPHIKLTVFSNNFHGPMRDCVVSSIGNMEKSSINQSNAPPESQPVTVAATNSPKIQCGKGCRKSCRFSRDFPEYIMKIAKAIDDSDEYRERLFYHASSHSTADLKMLFPEPDGCTTAKDFFLKCLGKRDDYELNWMHFSHLCALLDDVGCKEAIDILKKYKSEFEKHLNDCLSLLPTPDTLAKEEGCSMWVEVKCRCNDKHFTIKHALEHEEALIKSFGIDDHTIAKIRFYKGCVVVRYKILSLKTANDLRQKLRIMPGAEEMNMDDSYTIQVPLQYSCLCDAYQMHVIATSVFKEDSQADCESRSSSDHESADDLPEATFVYMPKMKALDQHSLSLSSDLKKYVMGLSKKKRKHLQKFAEECPTLANSSYTTQSFCSAAPEIDRCWNFISTYGFEDVVEYLGDSHLSKELKIYQHILSFFHSITLPSCKVKRVKLPVGPNIEIHLATFMSGITIGQIQYIPTLIQQAGLPRPLFLGFSEQRNILYFQLDSVASLEAIVSLRNYLPELKTLGIYKLSVSGQWDLLCDEDRVVYTSLKLPDTKTLKEGVTSIPKMGILEALLEERNEMERKLHALSLKLTYLQDECIAAEMKLKASKADHEALMNERKDIQTKIDQFKREQEAEFDKISKKNKGLHETISNLQKERDAQKETFEEKWLTIVGLLKPITNFKINESDENLAKDVGQPHKSWEETKSKVAKEELLELCMQAQQKFGQLKHVYEQLQQEMNQIRESSSPVKFVTEMSSASESDEDEIAVWLKVTNVTDALTKDDLIAYFQTARCGGGVVKEMLLGLEGLPCNQAVVGISDVDEKGIKKMLKGKHVLKKVTINVTRTDAPDESLRAQAHHLEELLSLEYKSQWDSEVEASFDSQVHTSTDLGNSLETSSYQSYLDSAIVSSLGEGKKATEFESLQSVQKSLSSVSTPVVKVDGIQSSWHDPKEILEMVFDEEEMSISEISVKENSAYVIFDSCEVAERVASMSWDAMGVNLHVSLFSRESDPIKEILGGYGHEDVIVLDKIPENVSDDHLTIYLEAVTRLDENNHFVVKRRKTQALMMLNDRVTHNEDFDIVTVMEKISTPRHYLLGKIVLKVSRLSPIDGILVSNIKYSVCKERFLKFYFAKPKQSGGKNVKDAKVIAMGKAIVTFEDPEVVNGVLARDHMKSLGDNVELQAYHPILTLWFATSEVRQERAKTVKHSIFSHALSPVLCENFHKCNRVEHINNRFKENKLRASTELDRTQSQLHIIPLQGSEYNPQWVEQCRELVEEYVAGLAEVAIPIPANVGGVVYPVILANTSNPNVNITYSDGSNEVLIAGNADDVEKLRESVETIVHKNLDTVKDIELSASVLVYIKECVCVKLRAQHPDVIFKVYLPKGILNVSGKAATCAAFEEDVKTLSPYAVEASLSAEALRLLVSPHGKQLLQNLLSRSDSVTSYFTTEDGTNTESSISPVTALHIVAADKKQAEGVAQALQQAITVDTVPAPNEFRNIVQLDSWSVTKTSLEPQYTAFLFPCLDSTDCGITVVCATENMQKLKEELTSFIKKECYAEDQIALERGQWQYFQQYSEEWTKLWRQMEDAGLNCRKPKKNSTTFVIYLQGEASPVRKSSGEVRRLRDSIIKDKMELAQPAVVHYFLSDNGRMQVAGLGHENEAVVEVVTQKEDEEEQKAIGDIEKPKHHQLCSGTISGGKNVQIMFGDLTEFPTDVIVNAANVKLNHSGGIAGAIARKGGPIIQEESVKYINRHGKLDVGDAVLMKNPGNLPCKAVVHAVGPIWKGGKENEEAFLSKAVCESLQVASKKYSSISFPAISSGIYRVPVDVCARAIFKGILDFYRKNPKSSIDITIMLFQKGQIDVFMRAASDHMQNVETFLPEAIFRTENQYAIITSDPPTQLSARLSSRRPTVKKKAVSPAIELKKGNITDFKADVLVCSSSNSLRMDQGAIARSFLAKGGKELQDECDQYISDEGRVPLWSIATTGGGKLPCLFVVHAVAGEYEGPASEKEMKAMMMKIIEECGRLRVTSVAIPAIGTGVLGFSDQIITSIMVQTISSYLERSPYTSIKKVILVAFLDTTFKSFQDEIRFSLPDMPFDSSLGGMTVVRSFKCETVTVDIIRGDITDDDSEGLVNTTSPDLKLNNFGIQKAFLQKGGYKLEEFCTQAYRTYGKLKSKKVIVTSSAGSLKCRKILHILSPENAKGLTQTIDAVLQRADKEGLSSLALPAIGTGNQGLTVEEAAKYSCEAIHSFSKVHHQSLKHIKIVLIEEEVGKCFAQAFEEAGKAKGMYGWLASMLVGALSGLGSWSKTTDTSHSSSKTRSPASSQAIGPAPSLDRGLSSVPRSDVSTSLENLKLVVSIYAGTEKSVENVNCGIRKTIDENFASEEVESEKIADFSQDEISDLQTLAREKRISLKLYEPPINRIKLYGNKGDVVAVKNFILGIIHQLELDEKYEREAVLLQKNIQWQWKDEEGHFHDYDPIVNKTIEDAFEKKYQNHTFNSDHGRFSINFISMKERSLELGTLTDVRRIDCNEQLKQYEKLLAEGERPELWEPMPVDQLTDKEVRLYKVELSTTCEEYAEVSDAFARTMGSPGSFGVPGMSGQYQGILKIERIQNPSQYRQYMARKKIMEKANPQWCVNERLLFHGCSGDVVSKFAVQGFNRSFAFGERSVTVYGKGVYFARDASYSARDTYSTPDGNGCKYIFYCRVLTGEFTVGDKTMIVPPPKNPDKPDIPFDSVVNNIANPEIFVVFGDAQAYPDYLITFH